MEGPGQSEGDMKAAPTRLAMIKCAGVQAKSQQQKYMFGLVCWGTQLGNSGYGTKPKFVTRTGEIWKLH